MPGRMFLMAEYSPFINAAASVVLGRLRKKPLLWYVTYFITNKCNLRCPYCYAVTNRIFNTGKLADKSNKLKEPTIDEIFKTIDDLYKIGTRYICLLGGEPLVRKDLKEIIGYIKSKKMMVALNTNGTLIDQNIEVLRMLNKLTISLEGDKEKHDKDRGAGTYEQIIRNIRLLKENNFKNFSIQMTVSTNTLSSWEHVLQLAKEVSCTVLITEVACRPGENLKEAGFSQAQLHLLWSRIYELKRNGYPIENSYEAISNVLKYSQHIGPFQIFSGSEMLPEPLKEFVKYHKCPMGKYSSFLDSDGTFYPCATLFGAKGYNIHELSTRKAYEAMSRDESCKCCRMLLNYQINYLFSSLNPFTLFHLALLALKKYSYRG